MGITVRRTAVVALRAGLVLAFVAAIADLPLPAGRAARRRIHLIDRSASVQVPGGPASLTPREARELAEADRRAARAPDTVAWIAFGRDTAVESEAVDPSRTALEAALEAALARDPTEIVLHSDGRGEPGDALLLAKARGVPVHVVALGPVDVRDARLVRVDAPSELDPGETGTVEVVVESTFDTPATLRLGDEARTLSLAPGVPTAVRFRRGPGAWDLRLEVDDAAPANNASRVILLERGRALPVLVLGGPLAVPGADVTVSADFRDPWPYSAVVVHGAALPAARQETLVRYVRSGGGLLLSGSHPREPLDAVAPVSFTPDHRVAVVIAVDVSGSMAKDDRLAEIRRAALEAQRLFRADDLVLPMAFATNQDFIEWRDLPARKAEGETHFAEALRKAGERLAQETTARKHVVMLTDGIPAASETPEHRKKAVESLGTAGLTVITIDRELDVGRNVKVGDDEALAGELRRVLSGIREVERRGTMRVDLHPHEATAGVGPFTVDHLDLTTGRPDAQLAATAGSAPAVYPAVAFRRAGHGLVGAILFPPSQ
ncbi:MAG TPA: vWA domain-containing protein, partial [Planctomycetota bacterium]|nr:vWA domain-containing protein [Planctomycetota bacterium]